ncbi:hypothetical protein KIH74_22550 [Kineosporia sp. J2-2]|uniref:Uncharacterized protein n=1 Tax=Kineosporia corallincola TaxID=2835133 RepID=A0ABS5TKV2_9ACTN|nr:hypothetical protein [Kineosporia corallincola]MBT0771738.1 hypothetical protein [Kineosporia corallincola]
MTTEEAREFLEEAWSELETDADIDGWYLVETKIAGTRRGAPKHEYIAKDPEGGLWGFWMLEYDEEWVWAGGPQAMMAYTETMTTTKYRPVSS